MSRREYTRIDRYATYRVRVTRYPSGRRDTLLVPANSTEEAEGRARQRVGPSTGGYHFGVKRVADYWREPVE